MPDPPRLTVALPTCNGARHLREALASIRAQEGAAFDLVVSDDRSDDDTLAIVRDEVGDLARVSVNSERLGLAGNWNRCVEMSRTDWVAIFHQDDVMRPGHLAANERSIDAVVGKKIGLLVGNVEMIDQEGRPIPRWVVDPGNHRPLCERRSHPRSPSPAGAVFPPGSWLGLVASQNPIRCSAVTTLKEAHASVGGFDPSFRYAVDWDFWVRVAREWGLAWRFDPPTVSVRWHPESETHRFAIGTTDLDEQIRLLDALFEQDGPRLADVPGVRNMGYRKAGNRRLARAFLNRAHVALKAGNPTLARSCLDRSFQLRPEILLTIALDPRLAVQMAALKWSPKLACSWFGRRDG